MLSDAALDQIFRTAPTHNQWTAAPVSDATLHALYELMRWGPTSGELLSCALALPGKRGGETAPRPGGVTGQSGEDPGGPRRRDHRL